MPEYNPLKSFVAKRGGLRLAAHGSLRDRIVEMCVEEFPVTAERDRALEVLQARVRLRIKKEYGSVVAMILISVLANLIARLVWEWWMARDSHRVLMAGWNHRAKETQARQN